MMQVLQWWDWVLLICGICTLIALAIPFVSWALYCISTKE